MQRKLKTVKAFCDGTPFSESQLRWWIFNAESNGLAPAIVRIGKRVYIDVEQFDEWVSRHAGKVAA